MQPYIIMATTKLPLLADRLQIEVEVQQLNNDALVRSSAGWRGGTVQFQRTASGWSAEVVEEWIT
jgi:hypothetical protein